MATAGIVKRNILANMLGGTWTVLLSLLAISFHVRLLGAEAYGLLGFAASLQTLLTVLDLGLSTTVNREIASDSSADRQFSRDLIQTASVVFWMIALLLGAILVLGADWIAEDWLTLETLRHADAVLAIRIIALWLFFGWPLSLYINVISGLQRLDLVNTMRVITSTLSLGGGIVILLLSGGLHAFLLWTAGVALVSVVLHIAVCRRLLPGLRLTPKVSWAVVRKIWRFSLDVNLISILAIIYTQTDRILIGWLLPLRVLGYYNAAYNLTKGVGTIQYFLTSAILPSLAADHGAGREDSLRARYRKYSQVLNYFIALPAFALVFFGAELLRALTTVDTAEGAHAALILLAIGFLLNSASSAPYILSLATGHTQIPLQVNLLALVFYLPGLYLFVDRWGIGGAGLAWALLNLYYLGAMLPRTQKRIMRASALGWLRRDFLPFAILGVGSFWAGRALVALVRTEFAHFDLIALGLSAMVYAALGFLFLDKALRGEIRNLPGQLLGILKPYRMRGTDPS